MKYPSIIVGGGPAGTAVLLSAHRDGILRALLKQGLLIVERSATLGVGHIGDYVINSDSTGATFLDPLRISSEPSLRRILETPIAKRIASGEQCAVPLQDVGELMKLVGSAIASIVQEYPQSAILTSCIAESATMLPNGRWSLKVTTRSGDSRSFETPRLVLATGASQPISRLKEERLAGEYVVERWGQRLLQSGDVLSSGGLERVNHVLRDKPTPKVAILGGSTSAVAVAHALLHRLSDVVFEQGAITLFHRKPLRVYYASVEEAVADGYSEFGPEDLCPVTKRVFRFAGLRLDSRELLKQVRGIGGLPAEPRIKLHQLKQRDAEAIACIDEADLVVAALGYRPNALPLFDQHKRAIPIFAASGPSASLVDGECRVLKANGEPAGGVYGIGLAAGYKPRGKFGGEPSFAGQANGLWLWQNGIGSLIARALLAPLPASSGALHGRAATHRPGSAHRSVDFPVTRIA